MTGLDQSAIAWH